MQVAADDGSRREKEATDAERAEGSLCNESASILFELPSLQVARAWHVPTFRTTAKRGGSGSGSVADDLVHVPPAYETLPAHPIRGAGPPQFCKSLAMPTPS